MNVSNPKTILILSITCILLGISIVAFLFVKRDSDLPVYNGKNAQEWFYGEDGHPGRPKTIEAAKIAFRNMGTNCVPYLISRLETSNTLWDNA